MSPHAEHLDAWDRRREAADTRPNTLPTRAPAGMLGARQDRRLHRRCDTCGRHDCACEIRGLDDDVNEVPRKLSRDDLRELGVQYA